MADGPGQVVTELVAPLGALNVGIRLASEIGEARNVDRRTRPCRNRRVVEVGQSAAGVLEAEVVHFVVADDPGLLSNGGEVAVGLLRGTRVRVLPEGLVFAADFDSCNCTGTDVRAQR